jgi:hypothetical protein
MFFVKFYSNIQTFTLGEFYDCFFDDRFFNGLFRNGRFFNTLPGVTR